MGCETIEIISASSPTVVVSTDTSPCFSIDTSSFATVNNLFTTGSTLYTYINNVSGLLGNVNLSGYGTTGSFDLRYYPKNNESGFLNTLSGLSINYVTGISGYLESKIYSTGNNLQTQINSISAGTGGFYLNSNPS